MYVFSTENILDEKWTVHLLWNFYIPFLSILTTNTIIQMGN